MDKLTANYHDTKRSTTCPACCGFKFENQELCDDCRKYRNDREEERRMARRRKAFGATYD
jgi:hypothetical protein